MNGSTATANLRKRKTLFFYVSYGVLTYGILTDERNSYVLLQRTTEIRQRRNGYVTLETTHHLLSKVTVASFRFGIKCIVSALLLDDAP